MGIGGENKAQYKVTAELCFREKKKENTSPNQIVHWLSSHLLA